MNIEEQAKRLWGKDLFQHSIAPTHFNQLQNVFPEHWEDAFKGNLLEIGCGSGADLQVFSLNNKLNKIFAVDIGEHLPQVAKRFRKKSDIYFARSNAVNLPFTESFFDVVYSFGVFHHTSNPLKCISEAHRVLKNDGKFFVYLYGSHEDIFLKRVGIGLEKLLMKLLKKLSYKKQVFFCSLISPVCWFFFSTPARFLKAVGFNSLAVKFPFHWGSHPLSLTSDLKDRLLAPVNHRFRKDELEKILKDINFKFVKVIKKASGLYAYAEK